MTEQPEAGNRSMAVEEMLCFDLYSTHHAVGQVYKPLLAPLGLTYPQYLVLTILWASDNLTVGAISERLYLESSTLTPLIKRLETQDLVTRKRDAADERKVRVTLTGKGAELHQAARHIPDCIMEAFGLPLADLVKLHDVLGTVRAALLSRQTEPAQ
ncbi:MarR family winged helix-turn-helix transcriptional regulator [Hoeflea ulvae]|uniref:MarR family transcriptional regulator n=1 Tax=Hoeflea ulvae TaxID=2983764 RepID=A0ABT3YF62_9HYPH|nr:MarR family transcriptional regulator [Hoeflea ulvae]MCY0094535.1 MarR family transcriptional regulator [Hoeflea ulvae]